MLKMPFTPSERKAIDKAFDAITHLCSETNWNDAPTWRAGIAALRKGGKPACKWELRARAIKPWYHGATDWQANKPLHDCPIDYAPWCVQLWALGAIQMRDNPSKPEMQEVLQYAPQAIAAYDRARDAWGDTITRRAHKGE